MPPALLSNWICMPAGGREKRPLTEAAFLFDWYDLEIAAPTTLKDTIA
jgi:hypothetical protein